MPGPLSTAVIDLIATTTQELLLTQTDLGRLAGIHQVQISRTFRGQREFTLDELDAVCGALGISLLAVIDEARRTIRAQE